MMISFFKNGRGGGAAPVEYLIAQEVIARDQNRDVIRDATGRVVMNRREPPPDVLAGHPDRMRDLIDSCPHRWRYTSGVVAFEQDDGPSPAQQRLVIDSFESLAFASLEPNQRDILWVRHTHENRVELHFLVPRMVLDTGHSFNIAPPGSTGAYDSLRDCLNKQYGWADPQDPARARDVVPIIEDVRRGDAREKIHDWILDRIESGEITDRPSMITCLSDAGFDIPRKTGANYLTVRDPETGERFRLKGEVFHEDWTRQATLERATGREAGNRDRSGSRLARISLEKLQNRLRDHIERRARYNRKRYGRRGEGRQQHDLREPGGDRNQSSVDQETDTVWPMAGDGLGNSADREQLRHDLLVGALNDPGGAGHELPASWIGDAFHDGRDGNQLEPDKTDPQRMQQWRSDSPLPDPQKEHEIAQSEFVDSRTMTPHRDERFADDGRVGNTSAFEPNDGPSRTTYVNRAGTRIDRICRAADTSLRKLSSAVHRLGETLDLHDRDTSANIRRWRQVTDRFAEIISGSIEQLHRGIARYRDRATSFTREQAGIDERRRSIEEKLAEIARKAATVYSSGESVETVQNTTPRRPFGPNFSL